MKNFFNSFYNLIKQSISYLSTISFSDIVDILIVAWFIFYAIKLVKRTSSNSLAKGIIIYILALWLSSIFELTMINFLLRKGVELGFIVVVILFQPELRRLLERLGSRFSNNYFGEKSMIDTAISQVVLACSDMSKDKTGALIIFERNYRLNQIISTGTFINSDASAELIKNIFFNKAPLHDGALIIRDGRIEAAGCVLPLTNSTNLSKDLGMRHRAGIGLSEISDAVVIIVSEETGHISCAIDGMLKRNLDDANLDKILHKELILVSDNKNNDFISKLKKSFEVNQDETE